MRTIIVSPYNPKWPKLFQQEAALIREIFGPELVNIHHIGSTSVPGLSAKPIIDILAVVKDIEGVDRFNEQMKAIGYEPRGEFGIAGRRYFPKGGAERTHHVHAFQFDNIYEIERHLAFRDYLRAHPEVAHRYGQVKSQLAAQFSNDPEGYMDGKDALVKEIEQAALEWRQRHRT